LLAIAARRNPEWSLDIFVSRHVVFYSGAFIAIGIYLVLMALGGYYVREFGGSWGRVGQIAFLGGAVVVLATLLASSTLRRQAQVFISKHFYSNKYDYRVEWLRFIATLSSSEESDVRRAALQAVAQIFASPGGMLFLPDESGRRFVPYAAWPMRVDSLPGIGALAAEEDMPEFLARTQWIIDTREYRRTPDVYGNIALPEWLLAHEHLRIVSPLLQLDRLAGFVVLYDPPPPFELTYEDRDLLKTVGRHVATHIAQFDANRKLAESRQFEAYNRLTAFMMHDLKNSVAQLKLIVANAERHKRNPEFVDDAIGTIANAVERMTRLIEQLRGSSNVARLVQLDLAELARKAVDQCSTRLPRPSLDTADASVLVRADPDRLTAVIEHVIRNAQDATEEHGTIAVRLRREGTQALLTVADSGAGMEPEFVRDRLFRPFDSTKGAKGMGIGAYQAREYVRLLGGDVEVQSSPGQGTSFSISLPVHDNSAVRRAAG
jgi:putative PEP-CTERM system histidine kinase